MSFGKRNKSKEPKDKADKFVPTTRQELKDIAKRARIKDEARRENRKAPSDIFLDKVRHIKVPRPNKLLNTYFKMMREKRIAYFEDKKNDKRWAPSLPQYDDSERERISDNNFIEHVSASLVHMTWADLTRLIEAAGTKEKIITFSQALAHAHEIFYTVLGVTTDAKGKRYELTDRDAILDIWPVETIEEPKVTKESTRAYKAKRARASDDEEDEDDEAPAAKGKHEDDDEDDAPPAKRKRGFGKKDKTASKKTASKKTSAKKPAASKKPAAIKGSTILCTGKPREGGGAKGAFWALFTRKGDTFDNIKADAKEKGIPSDKVSKWAGMMLKNGFIKIKE